MITISFAENTLFTEIVITDNGKGIPKAEIPIFSNDSTRGQMQTKTALELDLPWRKYYH